MGEEQYDKYVVDLRQKIAKEREPVEALMLEVGEGVPELLGKLRQLIMTVNKDSDPSESHWIVAQCRVVLADTMGDEKRIQQYLAGKEELRRYDENAARMEEALSTE